ncbi:MAG: LCP family protein [Oscillospiraceae bacterium]|nr:LCP family protein [Oscillospiraceae bacterium]
MGKRVKQASPAPKTRKATAKKTKSKSEKAGAPLGLKILLVLLLLLAILLLAAYGYLRSKLDLLQRDEQPENSPVIEEEQETTDTDILSEAEAAAAAEELANLAAQMADSMAQLEEQEAVEASGEMIVDENVHNILLIGTDERRAEFSTKARGDACILLSINTNGETPVISLVSFERAIGVPILEGPYQGQYDWLTHTFNYGGAELQMAEIRECFNINVDYYVRVNFNTFIQGIDAIGGIDLDITSAEARAIGCRSGTTHLNGTYALEYARLRSIDSDWKRIQRHRNVIQAALNQVKDLSISELDNLLNTVLPLVQTNLTDEKILELMAIAPSLLGATAQQMTIPESGTYGVMTGMGGRSVYAVNFDKNAEILNEFLYGQ